jgi:hypothetical protein
MMKRMQQSRPVGLPGKNTEKEKRGKMPYSLPFFRFCFF